MNTTLNGSIALLDTGIGDDTALLIGFGVAIVCVAFIIWKAW